jgi:PKD repeat protein
MHSLTFAHGTSMENNIHLSALAFWAMTLTPIGTEAQSTAVAPCGANELHRMLGAQANDPLVLERIAAADAELEAFTADFAMDGTRGGGQYVVPVVFHIIHNNGPENVSDEQVYDAMRVLNEDFNRQNQDWDNVNPAFLDLVADVGIEFRLAQKDPQGNCTKGITRTVSSLTDAGDQAMKNLIQWPRNRYMNVWICAYADGAAGYTFRPGSVSSFPSGDGIVVQHTYLGTIGTGSPSRSRTLTHEVGHWINLAHTWGNSNEPGVTINCSDDDGVADTPNTIGWTSCNVGGASCGSALDNVENYMEYSYCSKMFTNGQSTRMLAALVSSVAQRNQLWQPSNLAFTGVDQEPQLCAAAFTSDRRVICAGNAVNFSDESFNSVLSRTWSFPGGTPSSSTNPTQSVTYSAPGTYPVTLTVSDGSVTLSSEVVDQVVVLPDPGGFGDIEEGFEEATTLPNEQWFLSNPNNDNTFQVTSVAAATGSKSLRVLNTSAMNGRIDEFVSRSFDMSQASTISITFKYAFARRNSSNDDRLRLLVSNNCGLTWSIRKNLRGTIDLATAPNTSSSFVPTADQWEETQSSSIGSIYNVSDFRFKFEFESNGGNNVYIDDINLNGLPTSIEDLIPSARQGLLVAPNPAHDRFTVSFHTERTARAVLELLDVTGRTIRTVLDRTLALGEQRLEVSVAELGAGVYFLRLQQDGEQQVSRIVIE